ncbi:MAG: cupin domain-containing protein [Proteobacteria bacterium]|nr:cupin domain-containing protein [Pseudomonadota bacterium]
MARSRFPIEALGTARQPLGMSPTRFLRDYWQKRPLLVRGAFPHFTPPLLPDDLAGLACMDGALARLVMHDARRDRWRLRTGPFDDATFAGLPESDWTLLVQDVDKWDADTAALLRHFDFIPSWRLDDVMISYATDKGGVGAHVDQYDVFLLQGLGQRRWSIDTRVNPPTAFRDDVELKLLRKFNPTHAWTLDPGDMLYLPPGVPHDGVAVGECMTYSVGLRAPSQAEMLADIAHTLAEQVPDEQRYADPDLRPASAAGEIDAAAMARVMQALPWLRFDARGGKPRRIRAGTGLVQGIPVSSLRTWFGCFITRYRSAQAAVPRKRPVDRAALAGRLPQAVLERDAWSRFAWCRNGRGATLFAAGQAFDAPLAWAKLLAGQARRFDGRQLAALPQRARGVALLADLVDAGHLNVRHVGRAATWHTI